MPSDYNLVRSADPADFDAAEKQRPASGWTKSDAEDVGKIERLLDVEPGTLEGLDFKVQRADCSNCGKRLTMYDFVFTSLVDANHTKSFVLHTFVGSKNVLQDPRPVRCSACGTIAEKEAGPQGRLVVFAYSSRRYRCSGVAN
jgi:hypothetical protein